MRIGAHLSIAGGFAQVAERARELGCETAQVFSRSPRGGKAREISAGEAEILRSSLLEADIWPLVVHVPYFVNLAASEGRTREYTIEVIAGDMIRAKVLGAEFVVTHLGNIPSSLRGLDGGRARVGDEGGGDRVPGGAARGAGSAWEEAVDRVVRAIEEIVREAERSKSERGVKGDLPMLLLENQAGQGGEIGYDFREIGMAVRRLEDAGLAGRIGVCLDTCHAFAAGYDLRTKEGWVQTLRRLDEAVGLRKLKVIHVNDSKDPFASRRDRHEHIGKGYIGREGFAAMFSLDQIAGLACILETPVETPEDDKNNISTLKSLRAGARRVKQA